MEKLYLFNFRISSYSLFIALLITNQTTLSAISKDKTKRMADVSGLIGNGALTAAGTLFTYLAFKQTSKDIHGLGFKCYLSGIGRTGIYSSFDLSGNNAPYGEKTINPWSLYVSPALFLVCSKLTYDSLKNGFFYAKEIKKSAKKQ